MNRAYVCGWLALASMFGAPVWAQKGKTYPVAPGAVYDAALETVKANPDYTLVASSREEWTLSFRTKGGMRAVSGFDVTATFGGQPKGCMEKDAKEPCTATVVRVRAAKRQLAYTWGGSGSAEKKFLQLLDAKIGGAKKAQSGQPWFLSLT